MNLFFEQLFAGLSTGLIYGSIALALVVVFKSSGVMNIAQGELALVSIYLTWQWLEWGIPFPVAFLMTLLLSFLMGCLIERVLVRPIEDAPLITSLMVTVALLLGVNAAVTLVWGFVPKSVDSPFGTGVVWLAGAPITADHIGTAVVIVMTMVLCGFGLRLTPIGLMIRGAAMNRESSRYLGINVGRMLALGWGLAAAVGAVAGVMSAPTVGASASAMSGTLLFAFAAMILGGTESMVGAVIGGMIIGVASNLAATYVGVIRSDLSSVVPFATILVVLLFRPHGLFGQRSAARP